MVEGVSLDFGFQHEIGIPGVGKTKYSPELINCEVADVADLEFWWLSTHLELDDLYLVSDDGGLVALVEGSVEHLDCIVVELV